MTGCDRRRGASEGGVMQIFRAAELIETGATVHVFSDDTGAAFPMHSHDFIEIVYILSGTAAEYVDSHVYEVRRGDVVVIDCGSRHGFAPHGRFGYVNVCVKPEALEDAGGPHAALPASALDRFRRKGGEVVSFGIGEREEVEQILAMMLRETQERQSFWQTEMESLEQVLLTRLLRKCCTPTEADDSPFWRQICDDIDANLGPDLTLSALAGRYFYNPSYFSRIFREKFHMPLTEYVNRKKLAFAVRLARQTALSAEDIAQRSGFASKDAMYRAFAKTYGTTFSEFRRRK